MVLMKISSSCLRVDTAKDEQRREKGREGKVPRDLVEIRVMKKKKEKRKVGDGALGPLYTFDLEKRKRTRLDGK